MKKIPRPSQVLRANAAFDDPTISPVIRQTLQHWGYELTAADLKKQAQRVAKKA